MNRNSVMLLLSRRRFLLCAVVACSEPTIAAQQGGRVDWKSLPLQWAIPIKRGTGHRKIAVFADQNCDYCKAFEETLAQVDDITIYLFLYPVVRTQSGRQAKAVWCSKDRAQAWTELIIHRKEPVASPDCPNPIESILSWGAQQNILATPTWFLEKGTRHSGLISASELRALLDRASPPRK